MDGTTTTTPSDTPRERSRPLALKLLWAIIPLALLGGVLALIVSTDAGLKERSIPPIETLTVERITLPEPGQIQLEVINGGPDPITIAQVLVDEAYWQFEMEPSGALGRMESGTITIPYPWVQGEGLSVSLMTETGIVFDTNIPVAIETPHANRDSVIQLAIVGLYVGIVPIALGLLWYPTLRQLGRSGMNFVLALTVGLLIFLVVDMWGEAQEIALQVAGVFNAPLLVPILAILTAAFLMVIGQTLRSRHKGSGGLSLAYQIATGIGLHNLGEGLAIGAAFALGEAALGIFLIIGFTLHNVTEGIGIAAPVIRQRPTIWHFVSLAAIAGLPAIVGTWLGAFVYSPFWSTVFLAIGIGAIAQVVVEVGRLILRSREGVHGVPQPSLTWSTFGGFALGLAVMYLTALLVTA